ncbi:unnamed protein product [Urochloa decumbens]|uniref:UV radiation resistance-associated gene protein n=1 Tax=Urochloa decumbens TaxID=240449 RepID=A0ABC8W8R3_9POAL
MEDPGPSSAAPEPPQTPPPPPPPVEEGDGWVLLPPSEVEGVDAPKVIHWEDLQQELARLWSLSVALQASRERKARLAARLESAIEARRAFLQQDNELAEMRQSLQQHTDHLGDLKMHTKKSSEDVEDRRAQLCVSIRTLSVASKTLGTARTNLEEANKLLLGENGHGHLKNIEQKLRTRQQYMVMQVAWIYPVRHLDEKSPDHKHAYTPSIMKTISLIASYLNVPLRYPLRFGGSRSYVLDHSPSVEPSSMTSAVSSVTPSTSMRTMEFPLFFDGQETTRSAYAIFLLNKDIEQLLNYIGAESIGPRHVLANLKQLTTIIQSKQYISTG